jgi:hypothetical protein
MITKNKQRRVEYLTYLELEISRMGNLVGKRPVSHMHWGGSTPTFLTDEQIVQLMLMLEKAFNFPHGEHDEHEFSIEIDPRTIGPNTLSILPELGFIVCKVKRSAAHRLNKKSAEQRFGSFLVNLSFRFGRRGLSSNRFRLPMAHSDISNS